MKSAKILFSALCLAMGAQSAFAKLPAEITKLMNKPGTFISEYNGKKTDDHGTNCEITKSPWGDEDSIVIKSVAYFEPGAHLEGAKRKVSGNAVIYELNDTGKRPGGSVCGDYVPLLTYKKWVEVHSDRLLIKQAFRCAFERKTEITEGCIVKK